MYGLKVLTRIADSYAKYYNCRLKYNKNIIIYIGPEDKKDYILKEINKYLKHIGIQEIDVTTVY